mmetsp:Transcript_71653/g.190584  ORF Transcript_71653/g.190584 Transcript_71653/m.190584 type:complete len:433 (-) Transcript_71653:4-1302(-)
MQSSSEMGGRQAEEQPGSKSSPASSGDNNNCDCVDISPQPATAPPAQPEAGHEEVTEEVRAAGEPLTLQQRAAIMFSGQNGAPVASGDTRALATEPTLGLVRDIGVLVDNLPGELFDAHAPRRPCGVLDRYEASGMLLGDALGYPLLPRGKDSVSQKLGKAMKKLPGEIAPKQAAARKAAKRRGTDLEKAAGAVLDEPVKLTALPPKEDIPSQPPPAPSPAPQEPAPAPKEATPAPAPLPPRPLHLRKQPPLTRKERHQRARIFAAWDNNACECADLGEPAPGASDFVEHSMFCPIFRCYAYEVGCCGPHYSRYAPTESLRPKQCRCVSDAFKDEPEDTPRKRFRQDVDRYGLRNPELPQPFFPHFDEDGAFDGWMSCTGSVYERTRCCGCCGQPGTYVPQCPRRLYAGKGPLRGDLYPLYERTIRGRRGHR